MGSRRFDFKQFGLTFGRSALPLTTDASLLGAWATVTPGVRALDVGTGCGTIALMIAQRGARQVDAIDIHGGSLEDARENIAASPWPDAVRAVEADYMEWEAGAPYGLIVCNPPYFKETLRSPDAARAAARHAGGLSPQSLIARAPGLLASDGRLALVVPAEMRSEVIAACELAGVHPCRLTLVRQRPDRRPTRLLVEASFADCAAEETLLTISDSEGNPTAGYRALLAPFLLTL